MFIPAITYYMDGSAIPRVMMSKHPGPQPSPEVSHYDCTGVNCTQRSGPEESIARRPLDGDLGSSDLFSGDPPGGTPNGEINPARAIPRPRPPRRAGRLEAC